MKKIVLLEASPRKNGNTAILSEAFTKRAEERGFEVVRFDTAYMKILDCYACNKCFRNKRPCVMKDDFNKIAEEILNCDAVVFASPVYFFSFPANVKAVIDRFYSFDTAKITFEGKKSALISCCADQSAETFHGITYLYEETMKWLKFKNIGEVLVSGVSDEGDVKKTDGIARVEKLCDQL